MSYWIEEDEMDCVILEPGVPQSGDSGRTLLLLHLRNGHILLATHATPPLQSPDTAG